MNKRQKITLITAGSIILTSIIIWIAYGREFFTKQQVPVEQKDELFGWTKTVMVDKFVWGLDLSGAISLVTVIIAGIFFFLFRTKNKTVNLS